MERWSKEFGDKLVLFQSYFGFQVGLGKGKWTSKVQWEKNVKEGYDKCYVRLPEILGRRFAEMGLAQSSV